MRGFIAMMPHSVSEARVPIFAASLRRGVENGPQRIEIGRSARILARVCRCRSHFARPEMTDGAVAAREYGVAGHVGVSSRDVMRGVIAGHVRIDFMPGPAARLPGLDQPHDRRPRHEYERDAL